MPEARCSGCDEVLIAFELEGIEIDRCVECGGTWLDTGELALIAERAGAPEGPMAEALGRARRTKQSERRCPRCERPLDVVIVGEAEQGVEVDRCPRGHGLWLDRGEILALIRGFSGGEAGAVARFFADFLKHELDREKED